ncbi:hypothetical protein GU926_11745 [Nibribacter ruber]|uniref:Lipoprotein n=1 Tax=Nibribacter ruber TaxID=2698458 RepID=A0A6P1NW53_9BACT|nr:hypothetical protein [Nibribacter ruber]QHL88066.1 hypothetical protein GU926_11745 [Nibribacter ruber]
MRKPLYLSLLLLLIGCGDKAKKEQATVTVKPEEKVVETQAIPSSVPDSLLGYYINTLYVNSLQKTKSTKASQYVSPLSMVKIFKDRASVKLETAWNFHEGGADGILTMVAGSSFQVTGTDGNHMFYLSLTKGGGIILKAGTNEYKLAKCPPESADYEQAGDLTVNSTLFAGDYWLGKKTVSLTKEGKITGIDSLSSFVVATDYMDVGMSFDKIYFKVKGKKHLGWGDEYGYEFRGDTLNIYRVVCLDKDNDPTSCEEDAKGPVAFSLVRK